MFQIDIMSRVPIYEQIIEQVEKFIMTGAVAPGDQIPSVRNVSTSLSVNPVTILKAYNDLSTRGVIQSVPGRGYFVCSDAIARLSENKMTLLGDVYNIASELYLAGISIETVIDTVKKAYGNLEGKDEDK